MDNSIMKATTMQRIKSRFSCLAIRLFGSSGFEFEFEFESELELKFECIGSPSYWNGVRSLDLTPIINQSNRFQSIGLCPVDEEVSHSDIPD
jgi:hypothetical protein